VQESRALARRLRELPALRAELASGQVSFSMAQVIAKVASADDEDWWIAQARGRTVRAMRTFLKEQSMAPDGSSAASELSAGVDEARTTLTVTVDREDAWLFEYARMASKRLGEVTLEGTLEALLAEGTTSLLANVEQTSIVPRVGAPATVQPRLAPRVGAGTLHGRRHGHVRGSEEGFRTR
jgi:hypothetical protein